MSFFPFCRFGTLSAFHVSCICVRQPFLVFMFSVLIYLFSLHCPSPSLALFVTSSSIFRPLLAATMLPYFHRPTLFPAHFPFRLNAVANDSSYRSRCRPFPIMYPSTRRVYSKFEAAFLRLRSDGAYREAGEYFLSCRLFRFCFVLSYLPFHINFHSFLLFFTSRVPFNLVPTSRIPLDFLFHGLLTLPCLPHLTSSKRLN